MRKIIGSLAILAWVIGYVAVAAVIGDRIAYENWIWKALYFPIVGIAWIVPVGLTFKWIHAKDSPSESPDV